MKLLLILATALAAATPAFAGLPAGWQMGTEKDEVTDAVYSGLVYTHGADKLVFGCRTKGADSGFFLRVSSDHHLGWRKGTSADMVYRLGQAPAVDTAWIYDSRGATPPWGHKKLALRFAESGADQVIFRLSAKDGSHYDVTAPLGPDVLKALGEIAEPCS